MWVLDGVKAPARVPDMTWLNFGFLNFSLAPEPVTYRKVRQGGSTGGREFGREGGGKPSVISKTITTMVG